MAFIPVYIFILAFTIVIDYFAAILIESAAGKKRKAFLIVSIIANIGVLAIFKYYDFFIVNFNSLLHVFHFTTHSFPLLKIILPIGLSFHTFQAISYTVEVYKGKQVAERHFGIYALYIMFYPQLVAGPIERPQNLLHQFHEKHKFDNDRISKGLRLILWGMFMKIVVADRLAIYVNPVYLNVAEHNGTTLLLATLFFSIQIYCDFAGYSFIALGCAEVMGFKLMNNFNRPYFSKSISEFWTRWHISLSSWFRDYIYIPLGGNKVSVPGWVLRLLLVFFLSGLWHGADWKFIIWGLLNGLFIVFALIIKKWRKVLNERFIIAGSNRLYTFIQIITTFLLCNFAWIFFRANNISDAFVIIHKIFFKPGPLFTGFPATVIPYCLFGILTLLFVEIKKEFFPNRFLLLSNKNEYVRYTGYVMAVVVIILLGVFDGGQFIYFQF